MNAIAGRVDQFRPWHFAGDACLAKWWKKIDLDDLCEVANDPKHLDPLHPVRREAQSMLLLNEDVGVVFTVACYVNSGCGKGPNGYIWQEQIQFDHPHQINEWWRTKPEEPSILSRVADRVRELIGLPRNRPLPWWRRPYAETPPESVGVQLYSEPRSEDKNATRMWPAKPLKSAK